jgi:tRNA U34 5-carboxymethylaminomethyl modifying GTPase MnmE/TrmE
VDGWPVELSDTAGLHDDALHRTSIEPAERKLALADLVVLVFDISTPWSKDDHALLRSWPGAVVVHDKSDLPGASGAPKPGIATSALLGHGIEELTAAIADGLIPDPPPSGTAVPFTEEQVEWLRRIL